MFFLQNDLYDFLRLEKSECDKMNHKTTIALEYTCAIFGVCFALLVPVQAK